jgi:hypothetical protein
VRCETCVVLLSACVRLFVIICVSSYCAFTCIVMQSALWTMAANQCLAMESRFLQRVNNFYAVCVCVCVCRCPQFNTMQYLYEFTNHCSGPTVSIIIIFIVVVWLPCCASSCSAMLSQSTATCMRRCFHHYDIIYVLRFHASSLCII